MTALFIASALCVLSVLMLRPVLKAVSAKSGARR
jgi:hypothetical protein